MCLLFAFNVFAQGSGIDKGLTYLFNNQNLTGSWGNTDTSIREEKGTGYFYDL